jgi:hypothetical protein
VRVVTLSSYLDIKARSRLLMKGSFAFSANLRKTWARCLLNSLSNIANLKNNQKAECYPETTARQNKTASAMWISRHLAHRATTLMAGHRPKSWMAGHFTSR